MRLDDSLDIAKVDGQIARIFRRTALIPATYLLDRYRCAVAILDINHAEDRRERDA